MAKGKDYSEELRSFEEMFSSFSDEEKEQMLSFISDPSMWSQMMNQQYTYKCPNYKRQAKLRGPLMERLWGMEHSEFEHYRLEDFFKDLEQLPRANQSWECFNFLLCALSGWNKKREPSPRSHLAVRYVVSGIEHNVLDGCIDMLLELWRQNATFYSTHFDSIANMVTPILKHFRFKTVKPLFEFFFDDRLISMTRQYMANAIGHIGKQQPELRDEIIGELEKEVGFQAIASHPDKVSIDGICIIAAIIGATKLLPILRPLLLRLNFMSPVLGNTRNIVKSIDGGNTDEVKFQMELDMDSNEELTNICWKELFDPEFNDGMDDDWDDDEDIEEAEFEEASADLNDTLYYASSQITFDDKVKQPMEYELTVTLRGIEPKIWRKVLVPSHIKLDSLAYVLIRAMGWSNEHPYMFDKGSLHYRIPIKNNPFTAIKECDSRIFFAATMLPRKGSTAQLVYDFGDSWEHEITVTAVRRYAHGERPRIALIDGANACPPEDIGGIMGYQNLVDAIQNPHSQQARELTEWLGSRYDPTKFDLQSASGALSAMNPE